MTTYPLKRERMVGTMYKQFVSKSGKFSIQVNVELQAEYPCRTLSLLPQLSLYPIKRVFDLWVEGWPLCVAYWHIHVCYNPDMEV